MDRDITVQRRRLVFISNKSTPRETNLRLHNEKGIIQEQTSLRTGHISCHVLTNMIQDFDRQAVWVSELYTRVYILRQLIR